MYGIGSNLGPRSVYYRASNTRLPRVRTTHRKANVVGVEIPRLPPSSSALSELTFGVVTAVQRRGRLSEKYSRYRMLATDVQLSEIKRLCNGKKGNVLSTLCPSNTVGPFSLAAMVLK